MESLEQLGGAGDYEKRADSYYTQNHNPNSGSTYSQNLSRQISMASNITSTQNKEIETVSLLKQFNVVEAKSVAPTSGDATTASTGVQNSQVTLKNDGTAENPENR